MQPNANAPGLNRGVAVVSLAGEHREPNTDSFGCHANVCAELGLLRFRRLVRQLHNLGLRPIGELLLDVAGECPRLMARLERYAELDRSLVATSGAADWVELRPREVVG